MGDKKILKEQVGLEFIIWYYVPQDKARLLSPQKYLTYEMALKSIRDSK